MDLTIDSLVEDIPIPTTHALDGDTYQSQSISRPSSEQRRRSVTPSRTTSTSTSTSTSYSYHTSSHTNIHKHTYKHRYIWYQSSWIRLLGVLIICQIILVFYLLWPTTSHQHQHQHARVGISHDIPRHDMNATRHAISIFTIIHDTEAPHAVINAILSWSYHIPTCHIYIMVQHNATCHMITSYTSSQQQLLLQHINCYIIPTKCLHSTYHKAILPCILNNILSHITTSIIMYINPTIIIHKGLLPTVNHIVNTFTSYFMLGRRIDVKMNDAIDLHVDWQSSMTQLVITHGTLHPSSGCDYFIIPTKLLMSIVSIIPPFLLSVYRWDNWLISHFLIDHATVVIDISSSLHMIYQEEMIPDTRDHKERPGAVYNDDLVKRITGPHQYKLGMVSNADYVLERECPDCDVVENAQDVSVALTRLMDSNRTFLALVVSSSNTAFTLNFLTWAHHHSFSRFILLIEDRIAYDVLPDDVDVPMVVISRDIVIPKQRITRDGTILGPHNEPHAKKHVYQGGDVFMSLASFLYHALNERFHFAVMFDSIPLTMSPSTLLTRIDPTCDIEGEMATPIYTGAHNDTHLSTEELIRRITVISTTNTRFMWRQIASCYDKIIHTERIQQLITSAIHPSTVRLNALVSCMNTVRRKVPVGYVNICLFNRAVMEHTKKGHDEIS